jgi:Predicted membrane protein
MSGGGKLENKRRAPAVKKQWRINRRCATITLIFGRTLRRRCMGGITVSNSKRQKFIRELLKNTDREFSDEELLHLLIQEKMSSNVDKEEKPTLGQRAADGVARFAGSWAFIFSFLGGMVAWMIVNTVLAARAFDAYPFILLNLVLSCVAAVQAPLIMMSQNRQEAKDRARAESDYRVNLKNELVIDDLHLKMDRMIETQKKMMALLNEQERLRFEKTDGTDPASKK